MIKAVIALGSIAALILWVLKRWFSKSAKIRRLEKERSELLNELQDTIQNGGIKRHNDIIAKLRRVRAEINRLSE